MNDIRVYLDGTLVDVDPDTSIAETRCIGTLHNISIKHVNFTQIFKILLTPKTSKVLDNIGKRYNTSLRAYNKIPIEVYRGSTLTTGDSYFKIDSISNSKETGLKTLKGGAWSNSLSFMRLVENSLNELDFTELNHKLTYRTVINSRSALSDYVYLKGDYGGKKNNNKFIAPSVRISWLFDQIFKQNGFTYSYGRPDANGQPTHDLAEDVFNSPHYLNKAITTEKHPINYDASTVNIEPNVRFEELFEKTTQKDIIKMVLNMYSLWLVKDDFKNHYYLISSRELFTIKDNYVDFSDKYEFTNEVKFSLGYARRNLFKYKYDSENYLKGNNDSSFDSNIDFENDTKDFITIPFKIASNRKMKFFDSELKDKNGVPELKYKNLTTTPYLVNIDNTYTYNTDGLSWEFLKEKYYKRVIDILLYPEVRLVEMALTPEDIKNFDFFKLVYLQQEQCYYYCNQIINYVGGRTTKVELIRVSGIK